MCFMKTLLVLAATLIGGVASARSTDSSFESTLKTIPAKYLADIALADREKLLSQIKDDPNRMDAAKGWVHWFSDGHEVHGSSMFWLKELPREGKTPLVFVHMAKPFADGSKPRANQTFVLERTGDGWSDVTKEVMPAEVDLTMHFRTRKKDAVIEAAAWTEFERRDGGGKAWTYGERSMDLWWVGGKLVVREPASKELTSN